MSSHDVWEDRTSSSMRFDADAQALVGGRCAGCGNVVWPTRLVCHRCGTAEMEPEQLPRSGEVETWARLWVPVEGIEPPYVLASVKLGTVRVFGHLHGELAGDGPHEAVVRVDREQHPQFWFETT